MDNNEDLNQVNEEETLYDEMNIPEEIPTENYNKKSQKVKFIQNAIIELEDEKFDKMIIFCTDEAQNRNFNLLLEEKGYNYEMKSIPDGKTEEEIWDIFEKVYKTIEENDEIVLDITHSLRYLPMLGITLLQYAKFIKNIVVKKICYGLFDKEEWKNKREEFPIIDITSFSILQDWSLSGHLFLKSGIVEEFGDVSKREFKPRSKDYNKDKNELYKISGYLKNLSNDIHTNRGINIIENKKINELRKGIQKIESNLYPPFQHVLKKIGDEISNFEEKTTLNFIHTVEWCINRNLIQQGITMLQEGLVTYLLNKANEEYRDRDLRKEFSNYLGKETFSDKENKSVKYNKEKMDNILKKLEKEKIDFEKLKITYCDIKNTRNDINHGGFNLDKNKWKNKNPESEISSETLKKRLEKSLYNLKQIILGQ